jgi:hypothetical protein
MRPYKDIRIGVESYHLRVVLCEGQVGDIYVTLLGHFEKRKVLRCADIGVRAIAKLGGELSAH